MDVGTAEEFLEFTEAEAALIDMKLALADGLRDLRSKRSLTQTEIAAFPFSHVTAPFLS